MTMGRLDTKVCLITNGVEPLAHATVRRFARDGATVVVTDADAEAGHRVVNELVEGGGRGLFVHTEAGDKAAFARAVESAFSTYGRLDALVTGALRYTAHARLQDKTDAMFDSTMKAVFYPVAWAMQAALPVMRELGGGRIVNYCAPVGPLMSRNTADFNAASTAIIGLTNTAAAEWARHRVLCNVIALPVDVALANRGPSEGWRVEASSARTSIAPADLENDIAPVALFLVSEDNTYVTGSTITVDGGAGLATSPQSNVLSAEVSATQLAPKK